MEQPVYYWDPSIAVSGLTFYTGDLFPKWKGNLLVGSLKGTHMQRLVMKDGEVVAHERLLSDLDERIRDVRQGPDGARLRPDRRAQGCIGARDSGVVMPG